MLRKAQLHPEAVALVEVVESDEKINGNNAFLGTSLTNTYKLCTLEEAPRYSHIESNITKQTIFFLFLLEEVSRDIMFKKEKKATSTLALIFFSPETGGCVEFTF